MQLNNQWFQHVPSIHSFNASYCLRWPACCQPCVHLREQPLLLLEHLQAFQPAKKTSLDANFHEQIEKNLEFVLHLKARLIQGPVHFILSVSDLLTDFFCWSFHAKFMGVPLLTETTNQFLVGGWSWTKPFERSARQIRSISPICRMNIKKSSISHHSPQPRHQMLGNEPEFPMDISEIQLEQTNWKIRPNIHTSQRGLTLRKGYCTDSFNKLSIPVMHC